MTSAYKVSTITAVATISTCVDLDLFFHHVRIQAHTDSSGLVFAGKGSHGSVLMRGIARVGPVKKKGSRPPRFFDHQVTVIYRVSERESHNIKVFHNGNLQLTGVKTLEAGWLSVIKVADEITEIAASCPGILPLGLSNAPPTPANFRACLINSDFNAGYILRRDRLYSLMSGPAYSIRCVFETYYPGVKVQFMWNSERAERDGLCCCATPCSGKGDGSARGRCRKITMSVFQSGCCIITGAHTYAQLDDAHAFLSSVFSTHRQILMRPEAFKTETIMYEGHDRHACPHGVSSALGLLVVKPVDPFHPAFHLVATVAAGDQTETQEEWGPRCEDREHGGDAPHRRH